MNIQEIEKMLFQSFDDIDKSLAKCKKSSRLLKISFVITSIVFFVSLLGTMYSQSTPPVSIGLITFCYISLQSMIIYLKKQRDIQILLVVKYLKNKKQNPNEVASPNGEPADAESP